jgi:acetyl esterase/lipase
MFGSAHSSDDTYENVRQLLRLTPSLHHSLSVDYRKVTVAPFPGAVLDSLSAYLHLINTVGVKPENIVLGGDSAGGSLALTLMRYIRDELKKPEWMPKAVILLSPLASMEYDLGPKQQLVKRRNAKSDLLDMDVVRLLPLPLFFFFCLPSLIHPPCSDTQIQPYMSTRLLWLSPLSLVDSPWLSPASSVVPATPDLFAGFPPTFVCAGGAEVLLDGIEELVKRLKGSEVECGAFSFPSFVSSLLSLPPPSYL